MGRRMLAQIQQVKTARAQFDANAKAQMDARGEKETVVITGMVDVVPKHPTEPADGPKHEALGVIRGVQCSYPAVIEFKVESAKQTVSLYSNNYYKLEFSALGYTPERNLRPCVDIEGMKARVQSRRVPTRQSMGRRWPSNLENEPQVADVAVAGFPGRGFRLADAHIDKETFALCQCRPFSVKYFCFGPVFARPSLRTTRPSKRMGAQEGDRAAVVDLHVAGHGSETAGANGFAHGLI